ncbi:MAG: VWA domain-containing protein [Bacteroidetes bacterium]|jgi:Ca-activated chloride channel family protein|nr:VWA domain-containing protein [Bacteroidota bacterium]
MTFADPAWLWLLALVPVVGLVEWWRGRQRAGLRFSNVRLADAVPSTWTQRLRWLPTALRMGVLALGIVALARPQTTDVIREQYAEGIDIMLVLDTSTSMRAEDFDPNRFEAARTVASEFIDNRVSDRVGLIVFAAKAYTQTPLTLDYNFLQRMLDEVQVGVIEDGTAIGTALAMATNRLKSTEAQSKVIILLTDGQNNRGEIDPVTAAEVAETMGVRVYSIGVGTRGEAPFVVDHPFTGQSRRMMPVQIDEDMLRTVAQQTGGRYFRATSKEGLRTVYEEIDQLEKTEIEERVYTDRDERYPLFLWPAFGLLCIEVLLSTTVLRRFP